MTFLPWLRDGVAGAISAPDGTADAKNRAVVGVAVTINGRTTVPVRQVRVLGPGDVVGIDPAQVIRTDPPPTAAVHETNRFVTVELEGFGLPWLFTPVAPGPDERLQPWMRLQPWIALVVVRQQPGVSLGPGPRAGSTVLRIDPPASVGAELPHLASAWAWAHAQVAGEVDADSIANMLVSAPERACSRLLCSRTLESGADYLACVVPTFLAGRQAGMGEAVDPDAAPRPAWLPTDGTVALPVYHSWAFRTGEGGDFLTLASLLKGERPPRGVGTQFLDVGSPGLGVPAEPPLLMRGALSRPGSSDGPGPSVALRTALASATAADQAAAELPAPLYGASYAGAAAAAPDATGWLAELNLDPRWRVIAALGTEVVRREQEAMVAAAWEQAGDVRGVNRTLDGGQLARASTAPLRERHLTPLSPEVLLQVTAPAHSRMRLGPDTVAAQLEDSPAMTAAFRRITRPRGPVMRRVLAADARARSLPSGDDADVPATVGSTADRAWWASGIEALGGAARAAATAGPESIAAAAADILARLDPEKTVPDRVLPRVDLPVHQQRSVVAAPLIAASRSRVTGESAPADTLARTLVAPSFPTPMFDALARIAPSCILPGASLIPTNTVLVVETNPAFVAAFLAGLNSEMDHELVWRGFPVDRRATFFRHFWDGRGLATEEADIPPMSAWSAAQPLAALTTGSARRLAVVVVRGELFRRYPRALVYAVRAELAADGSRRLSDESAGGNVEEPSFTGLLAPDIRFFGFSKPVAEFRSGASSHGWFFVLQEPAVEGRFGVDPGQSVPLEGTAADVAAATLRPTARVAFHADDLLVAA